MKTLFMHVIVMLLISATAYSQSDRFATSVILANGDTLDGYIVDWKDKWPVREIQFTGFYMGSSAKRYLVSDLSSFYLKKSDRYYVSREIPGNKNKVLLQYLIIGELNLLRFIGEKKKQHLYIQKRGGEVEEVTSLRNLVSDCSSASPLPTNNSEKELREFVEKYNSCFGEKSLYTAPPKRKFIAGVYAGSGFASGSLNGTATGAVVADDKATGVYSTIIAPTVGFNFEFRPTRLTSPSQFGFQLFYQNFPNSTREQKYFRMTENYKISVSVVSVGGTYKHFLTKWNKVNFYVKGEVNGALVLDGKTSRTRYTESGGQIYTTTMGEFKKWGLSLGAGIGILVKEKFNVEARFKRNNTSTDVGGNIGFTAGEVTLGYLFLH
ncbi:MAG TPA: outer membrane beta-barrel protein [Cyclobacteriaceae bacterium]|nr:outer membrane beta-barrel protein [Cyclobacteriaceae bacterium]